MAEKKTGCARIPKGVKIGLVAVAVAAAVVIGVLFGMGGSFPLVKPAVAKATPAGYTAKSLRRLDGLSNPRRSLTLDALVVKDRFFSDGPTNLYNLLDEVDNRVKNFKMIPRMCMNAEPKAYNLTNWGESVTFYASCVQSMGGASDFSQFGKKDDKFYFFMSSGETALAAVIEEGPTAKDEDNIVNIWFSVGRVNMCGSRAAVNIFAGNGTMEMAMAGNGIGFCGGNLKSNGIEVNMTGSGDMGMTCEPVETVCVKAADLSATTCPESANTFTLPAIGRIAANWQAGNACEGSNQAWNNVHGASQYPGGSLNKVDISGLKTDSVFFGPSKPLDGLGTL